jgi:hypothetical protein
MAITVGTDSFLSVGDADSYMAARLYSTTWSGATTSDKERALRMATSMLCREKWQGSITSQNQLLSWPRQGAIDAEGRAIASTVIPQPVRDATAELALALLGENLTENDGNRGVRAVTAGSVKVEYAGAAPVRRLPDLVQAIIAPLLTPPGGTTQNSVAMVF